MKATFIITPGCNLACPYCYNGGGKAAPLLEVAQAEAFLDRHYPGGVPDSVLFFGGEPTLAMERMEELAIMCKLRGTKRFIITSNCTRLLDPYKDGLVGDFIAKWNMGMVASLDGGREAHNETRKLPDGSGSFDRVLAGLYAFKHTRTVQGCALRGTILPDSPYSLLDRLKYLCTLPARGVGRRVNLGHANLSEQNAGAIGDPAKAMAIIEGQYEEAVDWYIAETLAGRKPPWGDIEKGVVRILRNTGRPKSFCCGAGIGYFTCNHDGKTLACHRLLPCHPYEGVHKADWDRAIVSANRTGCLDCEEFQYCGGGCVAISVKSGLGYDQPEPMACHNRKLRLRMARRIIAALPQSDLDRICPPRKGRRRAK
jgi:radical SAM protein with 4Fe4S-binding SPASM domain